LILLALPACALTAPAGVPLVENRFTAPTAVVRVAWSHTLVRTTPLLEYKPQEFATAAVGDNGLVYIGSSARRLLALRPRDGAFVWDYPLTGGMSSEPLYLPAGTAFPEATLVIGDDDGALTALSARTGEKRWEHRVRGAIRVRPAFADGMIYFTSGEGRLYAVDARTGQWRWQYEREVPESFAIRGASGAVAEGGRVFAGFPDGYVVALNGKTGEAVWTRQLSGEAARFTDVDSTPVIRDGVVYATSYSGGVFALDAKDGSTRWRFELDGAGPLSLDQDGRIYVSSSTEGIYCLDAQGRLQWRQGAARHGELSRPVLWGAYLLLSAAHSGAFVIDARSGQLLQAFNPGHGVTGRPAAAGSDVYVLSNAGVFFKLTTG
jgi:outer membrane protein assembly factor BamB